MLGLRAVKGRQEEQGVHSDQALSGSSPGEGGRDKTHIRFRHTHPKGQLLQWQAQWGETGHKATAFVFKSRGYPQGKPDVAIKHQELRPNTY